MPPRSDQQPRRPRVKACRPGRSGRPLGSLTTGGLVLAVDEHARVNSWERIEATLKRLTEESLTGPHSTIPASLYAEHKRCPDCPEAVLNLEQQKLERIRGERTRPARSTREEVITA
jgi:hypothetical protein